MSSPKNHRTWKEAQLESPAANETERDKWSQRRNTLFLTTCLHKVFLSSYSINDPLAII